MSTMLMSKYEPPNVLNTLLEAKADVNKAEIKLFRCVTYLVGLVHTTHCSNREESFTNLEAGQVLK